MKTSQRSFGVHVRLQQGLLDVIAAVEKLKVSVAQSFLLDEFGKYVALSSDMIAEFVHQKKKNEFAYFVHAAYWSSLVQIKSKEFISLCQEASMAQDLHSEGIVVHIGATRARLTKQEQVRYVADCVNELLHRVDKVPLILENGPHAGRNFGGDLTDFVLLLEHVEKKERVKFCLDTAHAFVFGYELTNPVLLKDFFSLLSQSFGKERIALLHLNDVAERCGSFIDKHAVPAEGLLGQSTLQKIMLNDLFIQVPIILELPSSCSVSDEESIIKRVQSWDQ